MQPRYLDHPVPARLFAAEQSRPTPGETWEVSNLWWADVDWDGPALRIKGSVGIIAGSGLEAPWVGGSALWAWTLGPSMLCAPSAASRLGIRWLSARPGPRPVMCSPLATGCRSTPPQHAGAHGEDHPGTQCQYLGGCARFPWHNSTICGIVHATHLLLADVPVHVVTERLGHTDPAITLRV